MKIAVVGMSPEWNVILDDQEEFDEIWGINYYYELKPLKFDRVYDIHDLYYYRDSMDKVEKHVHHWEEHLLKDKPFRFFAPLPYPEVPGLEVYPAREVIGLLDDFKRKTEDGDERIKFFNSSFDYLMSAAILEEPDEIHLYGWAMGWSSRRNETEYQYQLPGLAFWTGVAVGKGIKVFVDKKSPIFKSRMYTYEGASVITRQTLETFKNAFSVQMQQAQAEFHLIQGEFKTFSELYQEKPHNDVYKASFIKKQNEINDALTKLVRAETAVNVCQNFLDNIDTAELDTEIKSDLIKVVSGDIAKALHDE